MGRSLKKGPFIAHHVIKNIKKFEQSDERSIMKMWSRASTIVPFMIGHTFAIHNGKDYIPITITDQMVGHKLGEFVPTRKCRGHIKKDKKLRR